MSVEYIHINMIIMNLLHSKQSTEIQISNTLKKVVIQIKKFKNQHCLRLIYPKHTFRIKFEIFKAYLKLNQNYLMLI